MATEETENEEVIFEDELPNLFVLSIKRQTFSCISYLMGAVTTGLLTRRIYHHRVSYTTQAGLTENYIRYFPMVGDIGGVIVAAPCLYFLGRRYSVIIAQVLFLLNLLISEYYYEQKKGLQLAEPNKDFMCTVVSHGIVRVYAVIMVVYVAEITQPAFRALYIGSFFTPFTLAILVERSFLAEKFVLIAAISSQFIATLFALLAPETPYWLALKGKRDLAEEMFLWLRPDLLESDDELNAMLNKAEVDAEKRNPVGLALALASPTFTAPMLKMAFMFMATDGVCRVFMTYLTTPTQYFLYDTEYEHELNTIALPQALHVVFPVLGSILFMVVNILVGRRIIYLGSTIASYTFFLIRWWALTKNYKMMRWWSAALCYVASHMGSRPIMLLLPAEIFPSTVKEVGVATCELLKVGLQAADFFYCKSIKDYDEYAVMRLAFVNVGIVFSFLFMPETKDLTLVQTEMSGTQLNPPSLILQKTPTNVGENE